MTLLRLDGVTSGYNRVPVIKEISLDVAEGSVVAVIGPNGHGKTTLLWTVSALVAAFKGKISFDGKELTGMTPDRVTAAGIIHVPQGDLLFPQMTVGENLQIGAYLSPDKAETQRRFERVYDLFPKLADRKTQLASSLSGGERRMVGIGRGLMSGGKLLMLDEPSLGLAPIVIDQIYDAIRRLKQDGMTVMLVEENPERAAEVSDIAYLIDNGRIPWIGPAAELLAKEELMHTYFGL